MMPSSLSTKHHRQPDGHDYEFRVLVVGDSGVGKTALLNRFCDGTLAEAGGKQTQPTKAMQSRETTWVEPDDKLVKLILKDTSGKDAESEQLASHLKDIDGVIVVYDITDQGSFESVKTWVDKMRRYSSKWVTAVIVGAKSDLRERRRVHLDYAEMFAFQLRIELLETSSCDKYDSHIDDLFRLLVKELRGTSDMHAHAHDREDVYEEELDGIASPARARMPIKIVKEQRIKAVDAGFGGLEDDFDFDGDSLAGAPPAKAIEGFAPHDERDKAREVMEPARHHGEGGGSCCNVM